VKGVDGPENLFLGLRLPSEPAILEGHSVVVHQFRRLGVRQTAADALTLHAVEARAIIYELALPTH
jgi:hypothetical protein